MKVRLSHITNSSSSSYIVCFARIVDEEKAKNILDKYKEDIEIYTAQEALDEINNTRSWHRWLDVDWAGIYATPEKEYIESHMDSRFIVHEHCEDLYEDEDGECDYDVDYYDFWHTDVIDQITEENGFADIDVQYGAGRNG